MEENVSDRLHYHNRNSAEKIPQHSQIAVTNYRSGRCLSQEFKIHMGLRFSPGGLRFGPRGLRYSPRGLRFSSGGLRFSSGGLRFSSGGLRFSPGDLRFSPRVFVLVHGVLGLSSFLGLRFRACLHGGGGPQVDEVTCLGGVKK